MNDAGFPAPVGNYTGALEGLQSHVKKNWSASTRKISAVVEDWQARELMPLFGYGMKWQNFESAIKKAMVSCEQTGNIVADHFTDASKMIGTGKGARCQIKIERKHYPVMEPVCPGIHSRPKTERGSRC